MLFFDGGLALIAFAVWVFCIIDVITAPEGGCRNLPKFAWLLIVIILPEVGSIAWLVAGRVWDSQARSVPARGNSHAHPSRAGVARPARPTNPDDDDEFLAGLRARAEEQRRRAREAQRRDEPPAAGPQLS
jgi:hypothetical protein